MKFDEIVEMIEGIKDPHKKRDLLVEVILVLKNQLEILNKMWNHFDMSEEDDGKSGESGD